MADNTVTTKGTAYTGNFIMQVNRPLDNRGQVKTKEDLLRFDNYVYQDMLVMVADTHELYTLIDVSKKSAEDYSGWKKLSEDSKADIEWLKNKIIENEQVTSQALNLLNALTQEHSALLAQHTALLAEQLHQYEQTITENIQTITIDKTTHNCGDHPCVTVYYGDQVAYTNVTVANGNLTISWAATPSQTTPILIKLIGK